MLQASYSILTAIVTLVMHAVSCVEVIHKQHLGNYNNSFFTGYLFTQQDAICFNDRDHALVGFADKIQDSSNPVINKWLTSLNRQTV